MISALLFAGTFAGLAGAALWRYPVCGLYLYLLAFYVHPPSRWWGYLLPDLRWSLLSAAVTLAALLMHRRRLQSGLPTWLATVPGLVLALLTAWIWVQSFWALAPDEHQAAAIQFTKYGVVFYLVYRLADTPQKLLDFLVAHVCGCAYLGWLCYTVGRTGSGRLDGVGGPGIDDANTLAMLMVTGFIVGAVVILTQTGWRRLVCGVALPIALNGIFLAGSRGAFLGLLSGALVLFLLRPRQRRWMFWAGAALGVLAAAVLVDQQFIDRMFTIQTAVKQDGEIDASSESRVMLFDAQVRMAASYPHGAGHKGTAVLSPQYLDRQWLTGKDDDAQRSSHNTFLTLLVEQGVPGAIFFGWMVLWGLTTVIRLRRLRAKPVSLDALACATACCSALAVLLISGMFTDYLMAEVQIWLFAVLAVALRRLTPADPHQAPEAVMPRYSTG